MVACSSLLRRGFIVWPEPARTRKDLVLFYRESSRPRDRRLAAINSHVDNLDIKSAALNYRGDYEMEAGSQPCNIIIGIMKVGVSNGHGNYGK